MTISLSIPVSQDLKPKIAVIGVGGAGGNAVNNMITSHLEGVEFIDEPSTILAVVSAPKVEEVAEEAAEEEEGAEAAPAEEAAAGESKDAEAAKPEGGKDS